MKTILVLLMLALAALAIPSSSAALPVQCAAGPTAPGGDTHCEGEVADCDILVHSYDQEDALNHYKAACGCVAYDNYGRPALRVDCYTPPPIAMAAEAPDLLETHCVADDMGVAHCTTVIAGTCAYMSDGAGSSSLACWSTAVGYCSVSPLQNPPNLWCENYGPGDDGSTAAAVAPPALPCQSGIAGSWCTIGYADCKATVGYQTGSESFEYAGAYCGPPTWHPCVIAYADTRGNVASCYVATAAASTGPTQPCQTGIAQSWCDASVGPCDVRVTPWTAWGDVYAWADCSQGITRCHVEAHKDGPTVERWCAF